VRIAVVSPYALDVPGGVQQQVVGLIHHLRRGGDDAFAVAPAAGEGSDRIDVGSWVGVRVNRSRAPVALSPAVVRRVIEAVSTAEVVHVHEPLVPLVGWAALAARKPTVVTFHADPSKTVRTAYRLSGRLLRRVLRGAVATAVSRTAGGAIDPVRLRPEEIPNAIDVASFRVPVDRDTRQVAFVGRPDPRKGRDLLLAAWPEVRSQVGNARLVIVGGGDEPPLEGARYLGRVSEEEKRTVLATSAVFCAPNRGGESFGITVIEGMAAGCAVVASDLDAFSDVLAGSGLMFPNGDRSALSTALVQILTDTGLRRRLAAQGSARVADFDWRMVTDRYRPLYREAVALGPTPT